MSLQRVICGAKSPTRTEGVEMSAAQIGAQCLCLGSRGREGGGFALRRARAATKDPHQAKVNNNTYPIMARSEPATHYDFYALDDSQFGRKRLQGVHD